MTFSLPKNITVILFLFVIGFSIYAVNLHNQLFWDDEDWIIKNPFVHSLSWENVKNLFSQNTLAGIGLKSNYYRPILFLTFAFNYVIHGIHPFGYHLVNNLLHIANAILIFILLERGTRIRLVALFTAMIFLVHPLQTEAVTYVAGRGDPLHVFFMLLALWALATSDNGQYRWRYILSVVLVPLALLARETAVIFPGLALVYFVVFRTKNHFWISLWRNLKLLIPHIVIILTYGILRLTVLNFENTLNFYTTANPYTENLLVRMYTFMGVLLTYMRLLILPVDLHMERSVNVYLTPLFPAVFVPLLLLITLAVYLWRGARRDSGSNINSVFRITFFSAGWFFVNLALTSGITPINAVLYEHWLYLALVGPVLFTGFLLYRAWSSVRTGSAIRYIIIIGIVLVIVVFSILSIRRNLLWGNPLEFYKDILKYEPASTRINNNVGNIYYDMGEITKAEEYYWKAVEAGDSFPQPHYNLGNILQMRGDLRGAIVEYEEAIRIDPNFHFAYRNLAVLYAKQGNISKVRTILEKLMELTPTDPTVYLDLGRIAIMQGDYTYARTIIGRGLPLAKAYPDIERQMLDIYRQVGWHVY